MSRQRINKLILLLGVACLPFNTQAREILVYGDSLSAAYGFDFELGWAQLLSQRLAPDHTLVNASISGATAAGGLARLTTTLKEFAPNLVLLELGANDGLRGQPIPLIKNSIQAMVVEIKEHGAEVVVFGITLPPSYGPRYIDQFRALFKEVAEAEKVRFFDLAVEDFIGNEKYIQSDGLHPTVAAQPIIEQYVYDYLIAEGLLN